MKKHYLVTGGAGFIGSNYVHRLLRRGERVTIYDNLSRTKRNIEWLQAEFGEKAFDLAVGDVRDAVRITEAASGADVIAHLAGQVAVTTSVVNPRDDFESNALGTFNVLEAARASGRNPIVIYASTNKVYGGMEEVALFEEPTRWQLQGFGQRLSRNPAARFSFAVWMQQRRGRSIHAGLSPHLWNEYGGYEAIVFGIFPRSDYAIRQKENL